MTSSPTITRRSTTNCWLGRPYGPPIAFVLHTESGGDSGTVAEFLSSSSQLSAHYSVALDGTLSCYIDPSDRAWANGILEPGNRWTSIARDCGVDPALNPNHVTIACDTEDGGEPNRDISEPQFKAVVYAAREALRLYPDSLRYLAQHADISPQSRAHCPGRRWLESGKFQALADSVGLKTVGD